MGLLTTATSLENQFWLVRLAGAWGITVPEAGWGELCDPVSAEEPGRLDPVPCPCAVHAPGFARSLGLQLPDGQRREWIKPIMFSGGIGSMEAEHVSKEPPEPGKSPPPLYQFQPAFSPARGSRRSGI